MNNKSFNDNELLYLIQEGNEEALEIMFQKYEPLIKAKVKKFNIEEILVEDFIQEGRLMLHKAIKLYDSASKKTFNKYFDLIMTNQFITLLRKNKKYDELAYVVTEDLEDRHHRIDEKLEDIDFSKLQLSKLEKEIYKLRFLRNLKISDICQILNVNEKTVYNTIQRVKIKLEALK